MQVSGLVVRVGDKVKIIDATSGARGADGCVGVVVRENEVPARERINGRLSELGTFVVKIEKNGSWGYWRVGVEGTYEIIVPVGKRLYEFEVITKGLSTKVIFGNKVGVSTCKTKEDEYDMRIGVLLATARALGMDKDMVDRIVDAIYGDSKKLNEYSSKELIVELNKRVIH